VTHGNAVDLLPYRIERLSFLFKPAESPMEAMHYQFPLNLSLHNIVKKCRAAKAFKRT